MTGAVAKPIASVAFIGVGSMGAPMARHAHAAGFGVTVCDQRAGARAPFEAMRIKAVETPVECATADVVIILVATPSQLLSVASGPRGLSEIAGAARPRYIVVSSTVAPDDVKRVADECAPLHTRVLDAPVSGGVVGAQRGTLTFLAGGEGADVDALRPLFLAMGSSVFHCGPLGSGQLTKTINNVIAIANLMISAEAFAIAEANGLTLEQLIPALDAGSARNFLTRAAADPPAVYGAWSATERDFTSVQSINRKDIDLARALAPPKAKLPAVESLRRLLDEAGEETLANWRGVAGSASG